ncbi:hypothetical protein ACHAWO_011316 [Cyclotella atomus]|uniref:1,3-beta-glucanosyltransferase n=1 Tax=Cyclotella atomus TaxID=382360 RepID=A0ABD3N448_9STRA
MKQTTPTCILDRQIINEDTISQMDDVGLSVFAKLCGANRGAFVLDPPDGKTYGCLSLPESFSANVNLSPPIADTASLTQAFAAGNITSSQTVDIIDSYVSAVYASSGDVSAIPYGCDVNGLATLHGCNTNAGDLTKQFMQDDVVRAVTLAGAFVPAKWATGGKVLSDMEDVKQMYSAQDFEEMVALGVNTVQIPVPTDMFSNGGEAVETLNHLMNHVNKVELKVILLLVDDDNVSNKEVSEKEVTKQITAAASYANSNQPTVIALQIPSPLPSIIGIVRSISPTLPIILPLNKGQINALSIPPDEYLYASLDASSTSSVSDVASSDSVSDRMKMFYHESLVCIDRSPIEYMACYKDMPVYVSSGFDLAIDDCVNVNDGDFKDYGQCDRFDETVGSDWWERHRKSLVERKLYTYSLGVGFSFSGWKLYGDDNSDSGVIDSPAKLSCLRDVAAAGLLSSLKPTGNDSKSVAASCLNGPKADFVLGDATLAPTPGPHDCGYGWWNATTLKCDYWIPPPPTPFPTEKPTMPCPSCEEKGTVVLVQSAAVGAVVALVLNWAVKKMLGGRDGYETLP